MYIYIVEHFYTILNAKNRLKLARKKVDFQGLSLTENLFLVILSDHTSLYKIFLNRFGKLVSAIRLELPTIDMEF